MKPFSWRRRTQFQVAEKEVVATREHARELCAAVGPWQVAADYGAAPSATLRDIAAAFALRAYQADPIALRAAQLGAFEGFGEWLAANPQKEAV